MSDLSELIKINRNIERQNEEIIRLLKIIAKEDEESEEIFEEEEYEEEEVEPVDFVSEVGSVYFIDGDDLFNLTIKNNETSINNLTGEGETINFSLAE